MPGPRRAPGWLPFSMALLILAALAGLGLVSAREHLTSRVALQVDLAGGIRLVPASGIVALKDAFLSARHDSTAERDGAGVSDPALLEEALNRQVAILQRLPEQVGLKSRETLELQLSAIRGELIHEATRQLEEYARNLEIQDEQERRRLQAEQAQALEQYHRLLEAQYASVLSNLQMRMFSVSVTERQEIRQRIAAVQHEINDQVVEREERNRLELERTVTSRARQSRLKVEQRRVELQAWAETEFRRIQSMLQRELAEEQEQQAKSARTGIDLRRAEDGRP